MSSNNALLPALFQPRMGTYSSAFLDKMSGKYYFNGNSLDQFGACERIKVLVLRILSVVGALVVTAKDLTIWIFSTREVVRLSGLKFHLANLISIIAFPIIAIATLPYGKLPAQSYSHSVKGQVKLLDVVLQSSRNETLTIEDAATVLNNMIGSGVDLTPSFLLEAAQKGHYEIIEALFKIRGSRVGILHQTLHLSLADKSTAEKVAATIIAIYKREASGGLYPIDTRVMIGSIRAMDEEAIDFWLKIGVDPCAGRHDFSVNLNLYNSPFVYLLLGIDFNNDDYPRNSTPRTKEKVVAIAKKCIQLYGAFNEQHFDELMTFKNNFSENMKNLSQGSIGKDNPYLFTLKNSSFMTAYTTEHPPFFEERRDKFVKQLSKIEAYGEELQATQISCHLSKRATIMEVCTTLPDTLVKLILQYGLCYTEDGEKALETFSDERRVFQNDLVKQVHSLTAIASQRKDFSGRKLMVKCVQKLDQESFNKLIQSGIDPCATNPIKKKAVITPFEHLLLGIEDLKSYPMRKNARNVQTVIAMAKRCIDCSSPLNKKFVDEVFKIKKYNLAPVLTISEGRKGYPFFTEQNPYFRLLRYTSVRHIRTAEWKDYQEAYKLIAEIVKRIDEIAPHLVDLQQFQIRTYVSKHRVILQVSGVQAKEVKLILQYALLCSEDGEKVVQTAESAITQVQRLPKYISNEINKQLARLLG